MASIKIKGMSCQHCVKSTKDTLEKLEGISNVKVDLEKGEATFDGDINISKVKAAISKIGFEPLD
ncbi:MAG: heavy-metal-associated domain-containing protein [Bacteroidetes bacterium]|nr:heavy-metal-associated domain-containing protein [Bacteroidota bacterium]